jgi:ABC-type sugar transport system substrate-binding protein
MIGAEEGAGSTAGGGSSRHRLVGGGGGVASGSRTSSSWRSLLDSSFSSNGTGYYLPNGTSTSNASAHAVQQISPGTTASGGRPLRFGIVNTGSPALAAVQQGWNQSCRDAGVVCYYAVSDGETCLEPRLSILREYVGMQLDGIAAKPCDDDAVRQLFEEASALGIPVVTFDSDVENSTREAYVGTDNHFVGATLARQLRQLRPEGGSYCLVGSKEERVAGFREVISKYNNRAGSIGKWSEVAQNESAMDWEKAANWTALLEHCARRNPTAIVMVYQSPMRDAAAWEAFARANRWRNITTIGVDASDYQLDYLNRRLVDGLVGQLPYEIGELALQLLLERAVTGRNLTRDFYPTNLVSYNVIPIELPPLTVNQNLLGSVDALGYACFALVVVASAACAGWTYRCRRAVVVQAAQPAFLHMVAGGTVVLASALVPLGMDVGEDRYDEAPLSYRVGICMSVPWLAFTGFTVVFSALFSKTWRVARLFLRSGDNAASPFARNTVAVHHVLAPAAVLMTGNFVVLYVISPYLTLDNRVVPVMPHQDLTFARSVRHALLGCAGPFSIRSRTCGWSTTAWTTGTASYRRTARAGPNKPSPSCCRSPSSTLRASPSRRGRPTGPATSRTSSPRPSTLASPSAPCCKHS